MVGTVWSFDGRRTIKQGEIRKCNIKEIKDICKDTTNPISREYMRRVDTHVNLIRKLYADLERPSTYSNGKLSWTVVTDLFLINLRNTVWTVIRDHERQKKVMKVYLRDKEKMLVPSKRKPRGPNKNLGYTPKRTNSRPCPLGEIHVQNKGQAPVKAKRGRKKREPPILEPIENPYNQEIHNGVDYTAGPPNITGAPKVTPMPNQKVPLELSEELRQALFDHDYCAVFSEISSKKTFCVEKSAEVPASAAEKNSTPPGSPVAEQIPKAPENPPPQQDNSAQKQQEQPNTNGVSTLSEEPQEQVPQNEKQREQINLEQDRVTPTQEQCDPAQEQQAPSESPPNSEAPASEQGNETQQSMASPGDPVTKIPHYNQVPLELFYKTLRHMDPGHVTALVPHEDFGDELIQDLFWVEYTPEKAVESKTSLDDVPASYFRYIGYNKRRAAKSEAFVAESEAKYRAIKQYAPGIPVYLWAYYMQDANLIIIEDIVPLSVEADSKELFKFRLFVEEVITQRKPEQTIIVITRRWKIFSLSNMIYYFSPKRTVHQGTYKDLCTNGYPHLKLYVDSIRDALLQKFTRLNGLPIATEDRQMVESMLEEFFNELPHEGLRFLELKDDRPQVLQRFATDSYKMYSDYVSCRPSSSKACSSEANFAPVVWVGVDSCPKEILDTYNAPRLSHIKHEFALAVMYAFQVNEALVQKDGLLVVENLYIPNLWDDIVLEYIVGHCRDMLQLKMAKLRGERVNESIFTHVVGIEEEGELIEDAEEPTRSS